MPVAPPRLCHATRGSTLAKRRSTADTDAVHDDPTTELRRWATGRAWSRAGAVAAVLATGVPRRILAATTRVGLLVVGSITIGVAVGVMLWNDFGPGPLDVFIGAIRSRAGVPLFAGMSRAYPLEIVSHHRFAGGMIQLRMRPVRRSAAADPTDPG